jgi:hypothetical protein
MAILLTKETFFYKIATIFLHMAWFFTNKTNSHLALANSYHNTIPNNHNALSNDTEFAHKKQLEGPHVVYADTC